MTRPPFRLLLPVLSIEEADLFCGAPVDALLSPGNLPVLQSPTLSLLAPDHVAAHIDRSGRGADLSRHAVLRVVSVDDLVLDHPFDAVPSLAYARGISDSGEAATDTAFVFLQPNLLLGDGSLRSVARRFAAGERVLTATHLHADRDRMLAKLGEGRETGTAMSPRWMVAQGIACLDLGDFANILNGDLPLAGPAGRIFWQKGNILLAHDFMPSLVAVRPSRMMDDVPGFRDVAFAAALCPEHSGTHFTDSDEFAGIALTTRPPEEAITVRRRSAGALARELTVRTSAAQRAVARRSQALFRGEDGDIAELRTRANAYVEGVAAALGPPRPIFDDPRWKLAHYLWAVRRFELGRGPLPEAPFASLLPHSAQAAAPPAAASPAGLRERLVGLARALRAALIGRVPLVTMVHPEWQDYRAIAPILRTAMRAHKNRVLYIGDAPAVFSGVLGTPAYVSAQMWDGTYDRHPAPSGTVDFILLELDEEGLSSWSGLVSKLLPALRPGGRMLVFHRNRKALPIRKLKKVLAAGVLDPHIRGARSRAVSVVHDRAYRSWLRAAYPVALEFARTRTPGGLLKGAALFGLTSALVAVTNLASLRSSEDDQGTHCASLTIIIDP